MDMGKFNKITNIYAYILFVMVALVFTPNHIDGQQLQITLPNFSRNLVNIYNSANGDTIIAKIRDNKKTENYYGFTILEKRDSMLHVIAWCTRYKKKIKGWIKITDTGVYLSSNSSIYVILYKEPNYKSKFIKIAVEGSYFVKVLDIYKSWLKVEFKIGHKVYRYWLPYEYQCPDIYNSCT